MMFPGREVVFNVLKNGIYYHDTVNCAIVLINTVAENREGFTRQEYKVVKVVRRALVLVGYPSEREFTKMVSSNIIVNCPVTPCDIKNA